jgi:hypothetical protein
VEGNTGKCRERQERDIVVEIGVWRLKRVKRNSIDEICPIYGKGRDCKLNTQM